MAARSKIQAHILIHTGEKPFACQFCEYVCNRKGSLDRHSKALHWNEYLVWKYISLFHFFKYFGLICFADGHYNDR